VTAAKGILEDDEKNIGKKVNITRKEFFTFCLNTSACQYRMSCFAPRSSQIMK
jgi:hypothetical protein